MYARNPWPPIEARADRTFAKSLRDQGLDIKPSEFVREFRTRLKEYYIQRDEDLFETSYLFVARELLRDKGYHNVTEAILRSALDRLFAVTQANWMLESDARSTLKILDFILTSAACSYRKPHPRIFELALVHWHIPASETAMVGDTLEADVLGAQKAGLYSIWITRRANLKSEDVLRIQPDLSLPTLAGIPAALKALR